MMPQNVLSSTPIPAPFLAPDTAFPTLVKDYELGGIALQDPSQGLRVQVWTFELDPDTGTVTVDAPSLGAPVTIFTQPGTTQIAGAFDQNMNPCVAFIQGGAMRLYWFDTVSGGLIYTTFGSGYASPRLALDDKRPLENGTSDIVLSYVAGNQLRMRMQRDRFGIERTLYVGIPDGYIFRQMGMNSVNRLQFQFDPPEDT